MIRRIGRQPIRILAEEREEGGEGSNWESDVV